MTWWFDLGVLILLVLAWWRWRNWSYGVPLKDLNRYLRDRREGGL